MVRQQTDQLESAGWFATERYKASLNRWRQKALRTYRWLCWPALAVVVLAAVLLQVDIWAWVLGLGAGFFLTTYLSLADSPPEHVTNWKRGAEGERKTAAVLQGLLTDGVIARHDIQTGGRNRDHLVVSPNGMFLIETKALSGSASVERSGLRVSRSDHPDDDYVIANLHRIVKRQAAEVSQESSALSGEPLWVQPIVVLWGSFPARRVEHNGVVYVHGSALRECIVTWPKGLSAAKYRAGVRYLNRTAWSTRGL